ncbi:MAG: GGDEF domain-containing protein [Lachnospiraceae bacterium]|nr:GGDEF domain-containing protein [Lachnospiraceae bacterium]
MYNSRWLELIQLNFLPVCIVLFLGLYLWLNYIYEKELTKKFLVPMILLIILIIDDNLDYLYLNGNGGAVGHLTITIVGYNIRIFILLSLILIELRRHTVRTKFLISIPAIFNLLITMTAFFSHLVFWFDEQGQMARGPMGFTPHLISLSYAFLLFGYGIYILRYGRWQESIIVSVTTVLAAVATLCELFFGMQGVLFGVIAMDVTFYYLYFHTQNFKMDIMTGTLNRLSFYADSSKLDGRDDVTVFSIDLNGLKQINDTNGHAAGDKAICEVAQLIKRYLPRGCRLYRTGGDEFVVIGKGSAQKRIEEMERGLQEARGNFPYEFAMGKAQLEKDETFEEAYSRADKAMYVNKRKLKAVKSIPKKATKTVPADETEKKTE